MSEISVHYAWSAVMADVLSVSKSERNQSQGFNFRGIDAVVNAVGPALRSHGVAVIPVDTASRTRDVTVGRNQTAMREVTVTVTWRVYGPAGDHFDGMSLGEAMDAGDKATPKAMSVAYRTFLLQALCIPTDEPDPDHDIYNRAEPTATDERERLIAEFLEIVHGFDDDGHEKTVLADTAKKLGWPAKVGNYTADEAAKALEVAQQLRDQTEPFDVDTGEPDTGVTQAHADRVTSSQITEFCGSLKIENPSGSKLVRLEQLVKSTGLTADHLVSAVAEMKGQPE